MSEKQPEQWEKEVNESKNCPHRCFSNKIPFEIEENEYELKIKIKCLHCGQEGWDYYVFKEREWR